MPPRRGPISTAIIHQTPEGFERYLTDLRELSVQVMNTERWSNRVMQISQAIQPAFKSRDLEMAKERANEARWLAIRISDRFASVREQLKSPPSFSSHALEPSPPAISFDNNSEAQGFLWRTGSIQGQCQFSPAGAQERARLMQIQIGKGGGVGSYFAHVVLPAGHYRLEGDLKLEAVKIPEGASKGMDAKLNVAKPGVPRNLAGVWLRTSTGRPGPRLVGTTDWKHYTYDFEVRQSGPVALLCEMRALSGKVSFNTHTFKLVKVRKPNMFSW